MELSYFLAKLFGLMLAIYAIALMQQPKLIRSMMKELGDNTLVTLLFSFVAIAGGLAIVLSHNIWEWSWVVIITLFGWAGLLKGVTFLMAPKLLRKVGGGVYGTPGKTRLTLFVALVFGLYLAGIGFGLF
jgi:hypothetical protein